MITYEDEFVKVKTCIVLTSEMRINTQFKNTLTTFNKSDITTKRIVSLPVDWVRW